MSLTNIGYKESPADTAPNYDQKWSDNLNINPASSNTTANSATSLAFDSNENTYFDTNVGVGGQAIIDLNVTIENVETLEFYGGPAPAGNGTITVTGTGITESLISNMGANKQSITVSDSTVSNLQFTVDNDNAFRMAALYVNGQILIDGPADNSQVWSDGIVGAINSANAKAAFNGVLTGTSFAYAEQGSGPNTLTWNAPSEISYTTAVEVFTINTKNSTPALTTTATVNGGSSIDLPETTGNGDWITLASGPGTLNSFSLTSTFSGNGSYLPRIWGVKIDGKLLIDAPPVWNTSQVWSDGQNVEARPEKASDGNTQTSYSSSADADNNSTVIGQGNEYALDNVGAVANKIEVLARGWLNSGKEELADIYVGANKLGTTPTQGSNTQAIWSSFDFTGTIDAANSLRIVDVSTGDYAQRLIAIRIDGEILVDGGSGSFGANGFHLPFDPWR